MPHYDYQCKDCGHFFEKFHSMSETPQYSCPKCSGMSVVKKIGGGAGVVFKGSGFYSTDYKKKPIQEKSSSTDNKEKPPLSKS